MKLEQCKTFARTAYYRCGRWHRTVELKECKKCDVERDESILDLLKWVLFEIRELFRK
jgi:hypothetical protein